jgi:hypothetical protein
MSKGIRFGLVFVGPRPAADGTFLSGLGIKHIEGCDVGEKHYVMFALDKGKRQVDVLNAVQEYNQTCPSADLDEELLMASDGLLSSPSSAIVLLSCSSPSTVVKSGTKRVTGKSSALSKIAVFERGYQSHDIFRIICTAKLTQLEVEAPPVPEGQATAPAEEVVSSERPTGYWTWGCAEDDMSPSVPVSMKRVINELESDLVEDRIKPSASKRVCGVLPLKEHEIGLEEAVESMEKNGGIAPPSLVDSSDDNSVLGEHAKEALLDTEQVELIFVSFTCICAYIIKINSEQ